MAALDKLVKALEGLKIIKESASFTDESLKRKEKATLCVTVADLMCSPAARNASKLPYYLSYSIETLLHMCDDPDSDIRMTADESLNRIIRAMMENHIVKVQVELHKEIKKNGSSRSLRAALWRFAELAHMIRPQKGKPYVQNLVPCIIQIAKRTEELVLETLAAAMPKIFAALGSFTTDNDIKSLLRTFLTNIVSDQTVVRRTAASSILAICLHCRKSQVFLCYTLNTILDSVLPVRDDQPVSDVLGVLNLTRQLLLHIDTSPSADDNSCNNNNNTYLGSSRSSSYPSVDRFIQVYELCLHWSNHQDHNVVTASLEVLQQLLICIGSSAQIAAHFLSSTGLVHSRILPSENTLKFSNRTLSEISVATPSVVQGDESSLLDASEDCVDKTRLEQWMQDSINPDSPTRTMEPSIDDLDQQQTNYLSTLDNGCASPVNVIENCSMQRAPSLDSEQLLRRDESPTPPPSEISSELNQVWDIGKVLDSEPALIYCARHLVTKFLLPDQEGHRVRVSVRALALSCISQVINLMPRIFLINIDCRHQATSSGFSHICDILLFATHADQQLRGLTMTVIGNLIKSALSEGRACFSDWCNSNLSTSNLNIAKTPKNYNISGFDDSVSDKVIQLPSLINFLVQGLEDESAICVRHTLAGVETCLSILLASKESKSAIPLLQAVVNLTKNPYWLIKVKVVELLSGLNYLNIYYILNSNSFQDKVFYTVILSQIADQDNRVRKATAEALSRLVENLFYPIDHNQEDLVTSYGFLLRQKYLSGLFDQDFPTECDERPNKRIEASLSRIVSLLSHLLLQSTSKHQTAGCCETLGLLSIKYPCNVYRKAWQCQIGRPNAAIKSFTSPSAGLLGTILAFLTSAPISLDLDFHHWLLLLAGNIYAGLAESALQSVDSKFEYDKTQLWAATGDKKFAALSEQLLMHVLRILYVFVLVLEDQQTLSQRSGLAPSPVKRRPSRAASPAKTSTVTTLSSTSEKDPLNVTAGTTGKEEKGKLYGHFGHLPHYCRLHDNLASAYKNYKITLEGAASEKFVNLLKMVLTVLGQMLEYCGLPESGRLADEILYYLRTTVALDPTNSVSTVQQLLKSLFSANYLAEWEEERERSEKRSPSLSIIQQDSYTGFYGNVFQQPYQKLTDYFEANSKVCNEIPRGGPSYVRERAGTPKNVSRNSDKTALASYIRLFEPMVIQALKKYTITSDVSLQMAVLDLLTQLVQLRVNYCLLDSDQIFINFIYKQFEFLEEGQILRANELIPKLFQFLVHLSHEKNHSKPVISFPRVIQLCAGLMASGQNPLTHCIPALSPVVKHVFLANVTNLADVKELETQREFLISMLLRLAEYPQVLHLLGIILKEGWRWEDRWRKWSRLTADTVLPMLAVDKILLDSPDSLASLLYLINSLAPGTLRPVDQILKVLFSIQQPSDGCSAERLLRIVLAMIVALVCQGKEDSVLSRLEELQLCIHQQGDDPLNVTAAKQNHPPQRIFANLLLHVMEIVMAQIEMLTRRSQNVSDFEHLFAHFLLCCLVMFQSGSYVQVATALIDLIGESEGLSRLESLNDKFKIVSSCCPILTLLWSYLLTLLNYGKTSYWSVLLQTKDRDKIGGKRSVNVEIQPEECLNWEVVRRGTTILFCDYVTENLTDSECLTWLMIGHIEELVRLSTEPPVQDLLAGVHRNPAASGLMVQAVNTRCAHITEVRFLCRLLTCLESVHPKDSGSLLMLLAPILIKHPHLVISRRSIALASRRVELLLTLDKSEVMQQISKDNLLKLLETLTSSTKLAVKHSGLVSFLNKLGAQCYDLSPIELEQGRQVNTSNIRTIILDRDWFLTQVKLRCCGKGKNGPQCALLLSQLSEEDIVSVLRSQNFDNSILQHCFSLGTKLTFQDYNEKKDEKVVLSPLFTAARLALFHHVHHLHGLLPRIHQVYNPLGRQATAKELKYKERIDELLCDPVFTEVFFHLVPAVANFLNSVSKLEKIVGMISEESPVIPTESWDALSKFSVLCMESIISLSLHNKSSHGGKWASSIHKALECTVSVLTVGQLISLLSESHLGSIASCIILLIHQHTDHVIRVPAVQGEVESTAKLHTCYQMAALINLIERCPPESWDVPSLISASIRKLIICVGRSSALNWHCRTPLEGWGPPETGPPDEPPPIISPHLLQDIDILNLVVFRMSCLGWTTRQQFEESWMTLLTVVRANSLTDSQLEPDHAASIVQGNSLAVKALTSLLLQTTLLPNPGNPSTGKLLHCPRDEPLDLSKHSWGIKFQEANDALCWKLEELDKTSCSNIELLRLNERPNIERRISCQNRYGYSQVSVKYMKTAVMSADERNSSEGICKMCVEREQRLDAVNLDVRSCIQFLLDLYSQWTQPGGGLSLSVLLEVIRSTLCLSDLFSERSHFSWMLDICLELSRTHPQEDEIMHQYLVVAVCKAASVLPTLETEVTDKVIKLLDVSLKGNFLPGRLAAVHGLLYLLQSQLMIKTESEIVEQKPPVVDTRQKLLQISIDYINKHLCPEISTETSEESLLTLYALAFYLLEHCAQDMPPDVFSTLLQLTQNAASLKVTSIYNALIQGIDRLILVSNNSDIRNQAMRLATEILTHTNPAISMPALQLLLSCIYSGDYDKGKEREWDSEVLVAAIEKTSTLFNRIKWAYPVEAECVCSVLPHLLGDFFPASEILSKVIGEFLAPKQPHPQLISPVVFQVFSQACREEQLPLLKAWVVMSLPNFTQGIPVPIATWCLSCFLISASTNPWLRSLFPHVQSRIGRCTYEDRKLLCIAASDFYNQLCDESQKKTFLRTFTEAASTPKSPFSDIIASISQT